MHGNLLKEDIMRPIKTRTYNNFLRVMRLVEAKGYTPQEAEEITRQIFDQYEMNPNGIPVLALVELVRNK